MSFIRQMYFGTFLTYLTFIINYCDICHPFKKYQQVFLSLISAIYVSFKIIRLCP